MKNQIAMFKFTLGTGQSIGPNALLSLWRRACQTSQVSVGRQAGRFGEDKPTYALYAPQNLQDLPQIESRLRNLLEQSHLRVSLTALHS